MSGFRVEVIAAGVPCSPDPKIYAQHDSLTLNMSLFMAQAQEANYMLSLFFRLQECVIDKC